MDRRQVQNVKAHFGQPRQPQRAVGERAMPAGLGGAGARKQLVPGAELGPRAIDDDRKRRIADAGRRAIGIAGHQRAQFGGAGTVRRKSGGARGEGHVPLSQPSCVVAGGPKRGLGDQCRANLQIDANILAGLDSFGQIALPGFKGVDPGQHGEFVAADLGGGEFGLPAVVAQADHRRLAPVGAALRPGEKSSHDRVVAVGEYVGRDHDPLARRFA